MTQAENLRKAQHDFEVFRGDCIKLQNLVNTFETLYGSEDSKEVLQETAVLFFDDLHKWLIQIYFVDVMKLTDPARQGSNENLTVCHILGILRDLEKSSDKIGELGKQILVYRSCVKDARNKFLGHRDLAYARDGQPLGEHSFEEYNSFLQNLQDFCDEVGNALGLGPLDYSVSAGKGDVQSLVRILRNAKKG